MTYHFKIRKHVLNLTNFLQRVSIACYAKCCISYRKSAVCPSVCSSVPRWHCVKTTPATIMRSSLEDSPMTLVLNALKFVALLN